MSNIWFSSDWHLNHKNIIKNCNRPFQTVEEMDNSILYHFDRLVKSGDKFIFIGDMSFNKNTIKNFLNKDIIKHITFYYILGNHDPMKKDEIKSINKRIIVEYLKDIKIDNQKITLCHYPMRSWNCSHWGAWMLHGHIHYNTNDKFKGKIYNVGVDLHNFNPVNYDTIKQYMDNKEDNWDFIGRKDK